MRKPIVFTSEPVPIPDSEFSVEVDTVILAIGKRADLEFLRRYLNYLKVDGLALVNDQRIMPSIESLKLAPYPDEKTIEATLRSRAGIVLVVPALAIAQELGLPALVNTVMLSALSVFLDLPHEKWPQAITELVPPKTVELNILAFQEGLSWAKRMRPSTSP
jgi:indolepyruvate ferredoxin oxidoreductase beta subunit